ncbi:DNA polymerase IV (plasmid) [Neorhizobium sp. NCHU2750]|nr:DNA polymerase IV [Neorhizobium sp. NCHU2750]
MKQTAIALLRARQGPWIDQSKVSLSDLNKPNGEAVITPKNRPSFVEQLAGKKFHGVGPATAEKMHRLDIETGADLKAQSLPFLGQHFGKSGPYFYGIARGIDNRRVQPDHMRTLWRVDHEASGLACRTIVFPK